MKKTRILSALLVLVLLVSMIPMAASAATVEDWTWRLIARDYTQFHFEDGTYVTVDNEKGWITESTNDDYDVDVSDKYNTGDPAPVLKFEDPYHVHTWGQEISRDGHFTGCVCGARQGNIIPHVAVEDAVDGRCVCGYKFVDDACLNVLWISNVKLDSAFTAKDTEYKATLVNKDAKAVNISAFTRDARATLEVSGDMILKEGINTITLKVTAEDKTENTYTVTIEK